MQKTVLVVDDSIMSLTLVKNVLKKQYRVIALPSAAQMFEVLKMLKPDLILLDVEMPEMNGFEAIQVLKSDGLYAQIPIIFLTGMADVSGEAHGIELGAVDFILKPFSEKVLINRIKTHLDIDGLIRERTAQLRQKTAQLQNLQNATIFGFADLVESRDKGTGGHVERTASYVRILAEAMAARGVYADELAELDMDLFVSSARLHDVGKIAISDVILNKPAKLTSEEFEIIKTHTTEGERAIEKIASRMDDMEFLRNAELFAGSHHERWDGNGYPRGLEKTDIPIQGRIMAFADVYDALVSDRPYKKAIPADDAADIIMESAGTQFDPLISEVFYSVREAFKRRAAAPA
ncbi:MAG: response regulator [Oscillospiraceae bacterium]|nr:response regulator [Oscillospiraceae bacterium]